MVITPSKGLTEPHRNRRAIYGRQDEVGVGYSMLITEPTGITCSC